MKYLFVGASALLTLALFIGSSEAGKDKKITTSDVMKKAMKGGLCAKVAGGKATAAEKAELVDLFVALAANTPPKGSAADWKAKTDALVAAAKADDGKALKAAANCKACHDAHK